MVSKEKACWRVEEHDGLFSKEVTLLGKRWFSCKSRPKLSEEQIDEWAKGIDGWVNGQDNELILRQSSLRDQHRDKVLIHNTSGRRILFQDNGPAHDLFSVAIQSESFQAVRLKGGRFRSSPNQAVDKQEAGCGSCSSDVKLFGLNRQGDDGRGWKLCHIFRIGYGVAKCTQKGQTRVDKLLDENIDRLMAHSALFLCPANMVVVPIAYGGLGEIDAFLEPFREDLQRNALVAKWLKSFRNEKD